MSVLDGTVDGARERSSPGAASDSVSPAATERLAQAPSRSSAAGSASAIGITFEKVEKRFGALLALRRVTLEISAGEFVALLGPNGAGKTTLLRIAAQLMTPTSGRVVLATAGVNGEAPKQRIGMVGHSMLAYDELTAAENLRFFARLYGLDAPAARAAHALAGCGLASRADHIVRTFSRGMRQRLSIARALLTSPRLLLLDEPAAGLDREGVVWLGETLAQMRADGTTVLMSTHARNESLDLATRAVSLASGRVERDTGPNGDPRPLLAALRSEI
jgi:heme exporter protein A